MTTPKIGQRVRGSKTGRPIMVVLDLLGRRTTLRILWELRGEPLTFRALQEACETNARLLNTRLTELKASGLVEHGDGGYCMTAEGRRLEAALQPLLGWAKQWAKRDPDGFDAADREQSGQER
ncbi:winged helix-turn-helix transcriptional regulator [Burkholderia lata]|uniref:winged helix-turn-helix transcriptional regulator n=1 Tax=Burkholderia lata (strain ATCC 17760 / DSM 23089 / LMG 22485 / NCIMB 9086 / R18194 / 383) TaxID=482957 RepID=UPI0015821E8C|nr:winged helix-turn-helix transcriptional regulator [Burkholderia lata]